MGNRAKCRSSSHILGLEREGGGREKGKREGEESEGEVGWGGEVGEAAFEDISLNEKKLINLQTFAFGSLHLCLPH